MLAAAAAMADQDHENLVVRRRVFCQRKKANLLEKLGKDQEALAIYDELLSIDPSDFKILTKKANLLEKLGKDQEALAIYDELLSIHPSRIVTLNKKALLLQKTGNDENALALYNKVLEIDNFNAGALFGRPLVISHLPLSEQINSLLSKADELDRLEMYDEALALYNKVLEIDKFNSDAWNNKARKISLTDDILKIYDMILYITRMNLKMLNDEAISLATGENYEESIVKYKQLLPLFDDYIYTLESKPSYEFDDRVTAFSSVKEIYVNTLHSVAKINNNLGKESGAITIYQKILEIDRFNKLALLEMANILENQGKIKQAISTYEKYLDLNPYNFEIIEKMETLEQQLKLEDSSIDT